jgi:hypothetical protein
MFCLLVSTVVSRVSFAFTVVTIVEKFPFTSDALAGVPAVKVVRGPTGPASAAGCAAVSVKAANSDATFRVFLKTIMVMAPSRFEPEI